MTPDEILDRAADEMLIRGSCSGMLEDPDGRVCMIGALSKACQTYHVYEAGTELYWYLFPNDNDEAIFITGSIGYYSDHHTHEERIAALKSAAKHYREIHQGGDANVV